MILLSSSIVEINKHKSASAAKIARLIWPTWEDKSKMTWYLEVPLIRDYNTSRSFSVKTTQCYNDHFDDELFFHLVFLCFLEFHLVLLAVVLVLILLGASGFC